MSRWIVSSLAALTVAGLLAIAGCEENTPPKTPANPTPPSGETTPPPKATTPTPPPTPSTPPKDEKKTASAIIDSTAGTAGGILASATTEAQKALTCAKEGCSRPGIAGKSLVRDGKTLAFCCDGCLTAYKKANNIQ
jgi:hypothetical protein